MGAFERTFLLGCAEGVGAALLGGAPSVRLRNSFCANLQRPLVAFGVLGGFVVPLWRRAGRFALRMRWRAVAWAISRFEGARGRSAGAAVVSCKVALVLGFVS